MTVPITPGVIIELVSSLIIIFSSFIIYAATRELYDLSRHRGIKYFRNAFLFFGLAFSFSFLIKFVIYVFQLPVALHFHAEAFSYLALFVFVYASTIAMFYLLYSVMWKKIEKQYGKYDFVLVFHLIAFIVSLASISAREALLLLALQAAVFLFIAIESYGNYREFRKERGISSIYMIYFLVFIFWTLNIMIIVIPDFFRLAQLVVYSLSSLVWLMILFKVLKRAGLMRHG